jgi:ubiquinone/menaquinone biosynthesis C-methylase UbiE
MSEDNGLEILSSKDQKIYSVGISTGGVAEMRMALSSPERHIIATTLDAKGAAFVRDRVAKSGLSKQIEIKIENVAKKLPYADGYFDYIYARLVLHYLSKIDLQYALRELYRILASDGKLFVVVRSLDGLYQNAFKTLH